MCYDAKRYRLPGMGSKDNRYGPSGKDMMERGTDHHVWDAVLRDIGYQIWDPKAAGMGHQVRM